MSDQFIHLVEILIWPFVAIVCLLVLGPGGLLLSFADRLARAVSDFTRALPELKETALTMRSDVETLLSKSHEMSSGFSAEFQELERRIDSFSNKVSLALVDFKQVVDDLDRAKIAEDKAAIDHVVHETVDDRTEFSPSPENYSADEMMSLMRASWNGLVDELKFRAGDNITFDARQVGAIAWQMADGRKRNAISKSTADLIQTLHSQFKRFSRMSESRDEWLTSDIFASFEAGTRQALQELRR